MDDRLRTLELVGRAELGVCPLDESIEFKAMADMRFVLGLGSWPIKHQNVRMPVIRANLLFHQHFRADAISHRGLDIGHFSWCCCSALQSSESGTRGPIKKLYSRSHAEDSGSESRMTSFSPSEVSHWMLPEPDGASRSRPARSTRPAGTGCSIGQKGKNGRRCREKKT